MLKELDDLKAEPAQLPVTKVTGDMVSKFSEMRVLCKSIACVLALINQTQKESLRRFF